MERKKLNMILWPIALLILNSLWFGISDNAAPHEINDFDHAIEDRTITLAGIFGQEKPLPSVFEVEFRGSTTDEGAVGWKIFDGENIIVAQWEGELNDKNSGWEGELTPGTYRFQTTVDEGIITKQTLFVQPFAAYGIEGHITLSFLLVVVALGETFARKKGSEYIAKKKTDAPQTPEKVPFSRVKSGMPDDDFVDNEDDPWRTPKGLQ
tara:strand:- start:591 stop:1217 length:627 start_codon:yes stop_codon:yes gene_type:complete